MTDYKTVFFASAIVMLGVFFWLIMEPSESKVIILNKSGKGILEGSVSVGTHKYKIGEVLAGGEVFVDTEFIGDKYYVIYIKFVDGKEIENRVGYLTNGINQIDSVVVEKNNIYIRKTEIVN